MRKILWQKFQISFALLILIGSLSLYNIKEAKALSMPIFSIVTDNIDYEEGSRFSAKIVLDTDGANITQTDLIVQYDPSVLEVVDQDYRSGVQIEEKSDLGAFQLNEVDTTKGEIKISIFGQPVSDDNLQIAEIVFNTIGNAHTAVKIEPVLSRLYAESDTPLGFRTTDLVITRIVKDYRGINLLHVQSTYLAEENKDITVNLSIDTEDEVTNSKVFYRDWKDNNENYTDDWKTTDLIKSPSEEGRYYATIPAQDVNIPGITYYFNVSTKNSFTTLPRPVTIEEAYKIKVLTAEEFNDRQAPTLSFNPPSTTFDNEIYVTVRPDEPNVNIYCTDNGTQPNTSSFMYVQPFQLLQTTTLQCFGIDQVGNVGTVVTGSYTKNQLLLSASLSANTINIIRGQESLLSWGTNNASQASIIPEIGPVSLNGSVSVRPMNTTTYSLIAKNGEQSIEKSITIYVNDQDIPTPVEPPHTGPEETFLLIFSLVGGGLLYFKTKHKNKKV